MHQRTIGRVALIGYGSIGQRHFRNLLSTFPCAEVGIVSGHLSQAPDPRSILLDSIDRVVTWAPDFVVLANPASKHSILARPILEAGIPCLIEKPLDSDINSAAELRTFAETPGIMLGYCLRFHPVYQAIARSVSDRELGPVLEIRSRCLSYLPDWRKDTDYRQSVSASYSTGGGVLLEVSHEIDYMCSLLGRPKAVRCAEVGTRILGLEVEEHVVIDLAYEDVSATIELSFSSKETVRDCQITGSNGRIQANFLTGQIQSFVSSYGHANHRLAIDSNAMYVHELKAMGKLALGETSTPISFQDGFTVLEVVQACRNSMDSRQEVKLK